MFVHLYAHYPISFISLFEQYEQVSYYVKVQEKNEPTNMDLTNLQILLFNDSSNKGIWLLTGLSNFDMCFKLQICVSMWFRSLL